MEEEANDLSQSCAVKKCGFFRRALLLTMRMIKCVLIFLLLVGGWGGPIPPQSLLDSAYTPLMLTDRRNLLFATRVSGCSCGLGVGVGLSLLAICLGLRVMLWNMRLGILRCQIYVLRRYQAPLL